MSKKKRVNGREERRRVAEENRKRHELAASYTARHLTSIEGLPIGSAVYRKPSK